MLKLLVNADDFGLSEKTNDGILQAHREGILTSASLMANGAAFDHAVSICRSNPSLDVGVHLTMIEESPLLRPAAVPTLVDTQGRFPRHATVFTKQYFEGRFSATEIRAELTAQIEKIHAHGLRITHVDSHQHIHMLPQILQITTSLAKEYGLGPVRFPREQLSFYMIGGPGALSRVMQLLALRSFCQLGRSETVVRSDHFAGFFFGGKLTVENLRKVIEHLPRTGTCELMCHPGQQDPMTRYAHWGYRPEDELAALVDPRVSALLRQRDIQLITFRDLVRA